MSLIPWKKKENNNPLGGLEILHREMGRIFESPFSRWLEFSLESGDSNWNPAIDVTETKNAYKIQAEVPGWDKKDLRVSVEGDVLTLQGQKKQEGETEEEGWIRRERSTGSFYRSFTLPRSVNRKKVKAEYKDGVLNLFIPKADEGEEATSYIPID